MERRRLINLRYINTETNYPTLKVWLLASEQHLYIGRNLAYYLNRKDLLPFFHGDKLNPLINARLVKNFLYTNYLRLIRAGGHSRDLFFANPYTLSNYS